MGKEEFDEIKQFKRDLLSYKNHKKRIKRLNDKLLELQTKLENVKSPKFEVVPVHTQSLNGDIRLHLIEEKSKVQKKIETSQNIIAEIDEKLAQLNKEERDILTLVYMEHVPIKKIARVYYKSEPTMYRDINSMILKIIEC